MINIVSNKQIFEIVSDINKIFNCTLKHTENSKLSSLLHQDYSYIIIDTEYISEHLDSVLEFIEKVNSTVILIIDEFKYNKNIDKIKANNIQNIILHLSEIHLRKELIKFLHNPNDFKNENIYTDTKEEIKDADNNIMQDTKIVTKAISLHKKHQRKLRKKYKVNTEKVLVVEKTNTFKFCIKVISNVVRITANTILLTLSAVGIICLIYPTTRQGFIQIITDNITALSQLF